MQKIIIEILQLMLFSCISAFPDHNDNEYFRSTALYYEYSSESSSSNIQNKYSSDSSDSSNESSSISQKRRHSRKCKCSCNKCVKPKWCCVDMCNSCIVTPPNIMVAMPYPVPIIIPTASTTKQTTKESTTSETTTISTKTSFIEETSSTTLTTTVSANTSSAEETSTSTTTTTATMTTTESRGSTHPPLIPVTNITNRILRCPSGISCIPKWYRTWSWSKNPVRRNLDDTNELTQSIQQQEITTAKAISRRVIEIPPELAESFLSQIEKINEIPEDERSIDVQELEVIPSVLPTEETVFRNDDDESNRANLRVFNEKNMKQNPSLSIAETSSQINSVENRLDKELYAKEKYTKKRKYIMRLSKNNMNSLRKSTSEKSMKLMNRKQYSHTELRTFATFPIQSTLRTTLKNPSEENENKINIFVVNMRRES